MCPRCVLRRNQAETCGQYIQLLCASPCIASLQNICSLLSLLQQLRRRVRANHQCSTLELARSLSTCSLSWKVRSHPFEVVFFNRVLQAPLQRSGEQLVILRDCRAFVSEQCDDFAGGGESSSPAPLDSPAGVLALTPLGSIRELRSIPAYSPFLRSCLCLLLPSPLLSRRWLYMLMVLQLK